MAAMFCSFILAKLAVTLPMLFFNSSMAAFCLRVISAAATAALPASSVAAVLLLITAVLSSGLNPKNSLTASVASPRAEFILAAVSGNIALNAIAAAPMAVNTLPKIVPNFSTLTIKPSVVVNKPPRATCRACMAAVALPKALNAINAAANLAMFSMKLPRRSWSIALINLAIGSRISSRVNLTLLMAFSKLSCSSAARAIDSAYF